MRFSEQDVDQARAAGVLIEFEHGRPIIVDRPLYRELVKEAIKRTHAELEAKATVAAEEKKATRAANEPADPVAVAKRERDAQLRELTDQAHGANLDLGVSLIHKLAAVDPDDLDVARFFVLCGHRHRTTHENQGLPLGSQAQFASISAGGSVAVTGLRALDRLLRPPISADPLSMCPIGPGSGVCGRAPARPAARRSAQIALGWRWASVTTS